MSTLRLDFKVVTPVFCAGADQNGPAAIRPFSIRGALRWFYRALDANFAAHEGKYFGSTAGGQGQASPFTLFVEPRAGGTWPSQSYRQELRVQDAMSRGECYLGYSLYMGDKGRDFEHSDRQGKDEKRRQAVPPGTCFRVFVSPTWPVQKDHDNHTFKAWSACLWLFAHLGGLGARARRGFGSLQLVGWTAEHPWPTLPTIEARDVQGWHQQFRAGFDQIREWFDRPVPSETGHQVLPKDLTPLVSMTGFASWQEALRDIGNRFRDFRLDPHVRPHIDKVASFGLPLASRSRSDTLVPVSHAALAISDRSASRLWIRVVRVGDLYHPMVWNCDGPLLPFGHNKLRWKSGQHVTAPSGLGLIPQFLAKLRQEGYV